MTDIDEHSYDTWMGRQVLDREDNKIGKVSQIYLDNQTGRPEWLAINTGLFKTRSSFVPLGDAVVEGDQVKVPFDKAAVKDAPQVDDSDGELTAEEEEQLYRYYDRAYPAPAGGADDDGVGVGSAMGGPVSDEEPVGRDTSGPNTDEAMTRSEERLQVGTQRRETGRARLRKYVVTEQVTQTVPVSHEEIRVEREPVTDANVGAATSGPDISEEEHEITLNEERPVVAKEVRPVERVRLAKETVADEATVSDAIRKEVIETDGGDPGRANP
jgi:uncharacterized protein (TIGR02271 family)